MIIILSSDTEKKEMYIAIGLFRERSFVFVQIDCFREQEELLVKSAVFNEDCRATRAIFFCGLEMNESVP